MVQYSIIIATYNRLSELKELIESLDQLEFSKSKFELIIADDGSTDGTRAFIGSLNKPYEIIYLYQPNKGPGQARNLGMQTARGDYYIFLDSDCTVPVHWLHAIDNGIREEKLDAFGGPDTYHQSFSPLLKAINYSMTSFIGTGGTRGKKKSVGKFYPRSFNMGISKAIFEQIGGMGQLRHGQDMDLSARIYKAGFKVGLIGEAFVYHKRRTSLSKFFRQIFNWGVARVNLGQTHESLLKVVHFLPSIVIITTLITILVGISFDIAWMWQLTFVGFLAICSWAFFESLSIYKDIRVALLSVLTLNIQVSAYGLGMLWAWPQALQGREAKGFVKGYYGRKSSESR